MTKDVLFTLLNKANTRDEVLSIIEAFVEDSVSETDETETENQDVTV